MFNNQTPFSIGVTWRGYGLVFRFVTEVSIHVVRKLQRLSVWLPTFSQVVGYTYILSIHSIYSWLPLAILGNINVTNTGVS